MEREIRVGVFDSGIGGLTVLCDCLRIFPEANYLYFGDNANAPYGNRPDGEIYALVQRGVARLVANGADAVVLACNTATAVCAETLRATLSIPVVGVEPAVKPAAARCRRVLVLATCRTARSLRLKNLIARFPECEFTVHGSKELAGAIEEAARRGTFSGLRRYLPEGEYDGVVLGCTHYVFLKDAVSAFYRAPVFDGNEGAAVQLRTLLTGAEVDAEWSKHTKTNKSLSIKWRRNGHDRVTFLGKDAAFNRKLCKQMFKKAVFAPF